MEWFVIAVAGVGIIVLFTIVAGLFRASRATVEPLEQLGCPRCGRAMETGTLEIKGTPLGLLVIGLSYQNLWFYPDAGGEELVLRSREPTGGWRCRSCGAVVVPA